MTEELARLGAAELSAPAEGEPRPMIGWQNRAALWALPLPRCRW